MIKDRKFDLFNRGIFLLGLVGLMVTAYLAYEYSLPTPVGCPIGGESCEIVRRSEYSKFLGISVPYFGVLFYLFVILESIGQTIIKSLKILKLQLFGSLIAFLFGVYLTLLEGFIIKAFCTWCVISFIISISILIISFLRYREVFNEDRE